MGVMAVGMGWWIWLSGYFSIDDVRVEGDNPETTRAVKERLSASVSGHNLLFLDTAAASANLLEAVPQARRIDIRKEWPRSLDVWTDARQPLGVWCRSLSRDRECFLFDRERLWGSAVPSRGTLLLTVMDEHPEGAPLPDLVDDLFMLVTRLKGLDILVAGITLPAGSLNEIRADTTEGVAILFSRESSVSVELDVLETFLADRRGAGMPEPAYIDVRVPGKVYFR